MSIANVDPDEAPYNFDISGTGLIPEMNVQGGTPATDIVDGDASPSTGEGTDFGSVEVIGGSATQTYTIQNTGTGVLNLGSDSVTVSGTGFALEGSQPATTVAAGTSVSFQVKFDPSASGAATGSVSIANDDPDEAPVSYTHLTLPTITGV